MQLKYRRESNIGSSIIRFLIRITILCLVFILAIFLIEKVNFPSPEKKFKIDITDDIKKLK